VLFYYSAPAGPCYADPTIDPLTPAGAAAAADADELPCLLPPDEQAAELHAALAPMLAVAARLTTGFRELVFAAVNIRANQLPMPLDNMARPSLSYHAVGRKDVPKVLMTMSRGHLSLEQMMGSFQDIASPKAWAWVDTLAHAASDLGLDHLVKQWHDAAFWAENEGDVARLHARMAELAPEHGLTYTGKPARRAAAKKATPGKDEL
jgi:hypothetical protein